MSRLIRTSAIIEDCEKIVSDPQFMDSPIISYLAQHALIVFCAEMQEEIYLIVQERAKSAQDEKLANFVSNAAKRILRGVSKSELSRFVEQFGQEEKDKFNNSLKDEEVTIYNNAVMNRNKVAHRSGAQVAFSDVKEAVRIATEILNALESSIM